MLKNDERAAAERRQPVALIGRHAVETIDMGGGSAQVNPPYQVSVAEGLTARLGGDVTVVDGVEVRTRPVPARGGFLTDPETGEPGVHIALLGPGGGVLEERHGVGRDARRRPGRRGRRRHRAGALPGPIVTGGPVELGGLGVGSWHVGAAADAADSAAGLRRR